MAGKDLTIKIGFDHTQLVSRRARDLAGQVVRKTAADIEADVKQSFSPPKHGQVYRRGGRIHQASAPGEAPAVDTSQLRNATRVVAVSDLESWVVEPPEYAFYLECFMDRAHLGPAVERHRRAFELALSQVVRLG